VTEKIASPEELARLAYAASIRLLARRDHSVQELTRKLRKREHSEEAIATTLEELLDANYLNDERYAELYAFQRMEQGYGPLAIQSRLRERGLSPRYIHSALVGLGVDWTEKAEQLIHKRFNPTEIQDTEQRIVARIARFVQARGYAPSDAFRGLKNARSNVES